MLMVCAMHRYTRWAISALSVSALLACGGGGGGGADTTGGSDVAVMSAEYTPLAVGDGWVYKQVDTQREFVMRVKDKTSVRNAEVMRVESIDFLTSPYADVSFYAIDRDGVREVFDDEDQVLEAIGSVNLLKFGVSSFEVLNKTIQLPDRDGDGVPENLELKLSAVVVGREPVTIGLGEFQDVLRVKTTLDASITYSRNAGKEAVLNEVEESWYAKGIGRIKYSDSDGTYELLAYKVGDRFSATGVLSIQTPPVAKTGPGGVLGVVFNGLLDPATVRAQSMTVTNAAGQAVPGVTTVAGRQLLFTPQAGAMVTAGMYGVRLNIGVQNWLGMGLAAPLSWSLEVDATAPTLLSVTPGRGAVDVPLDTPVVLTFSEPVFTTASMNRSDLSQSVALYSSASGPTETIEARISVSGATVTLTPNASLNRRRLYELVLINLVDESGNRMDFERVTFTTSQGMFSSPRIFDGGSLLSGSLAVAHTDIDGDGIADLIFSGNSAGVETRQTDLYMRRGQGGGEFLPKQRIWADSDAMSSCPIESIATADVNFDGRKDIGLGSATCGAIILLQNSDRSFALSQRLSGNGSNIQFIRMSANVDHYTLLLDSMYFAPSISKGSPNGLFAPLTELGQGRRLAVGDLNKDGFLDVVTTSPVSVGSTQLGIFVYLGNGAGFGQPKQYLSELDWPLVSGVAVGDVNGDGVPDVLALISGNSPYSKLRVYLGDGAGGLGTPVIYDVKDIPEAVRVADINGDGRQDVLITHSGWMTLSVLEQLPNGALGTPLLFNAPYGSSQGALLVTDINGDDRQDVVMGNTVSLQMPPAGRQASIASLSVMRLSSSAQVGVASGEAIRSAPAAFGIGWRKLRRL